MTKYDLSFKQAVVEFYNRGDCGYEAVGDRFRIGHSTVRKWVASFAQHGLAGLEKKFSHYDADFRLSVLERMWKDGLSRREAAVLFNIRSAGCLTVWERLYERGGLAALAPRRKGRRRSMPKRPVPVSPTPPAAHTGTDEAKSREVLLAELNYLRMENAYLKKLEALTQARHARTRSKPSKR